MQQADHHIEPRPRSVVLLCILGVCAALVFAGFSALGTWQVQRLHWKLDLIERVNARVHAAAVAAPGSERWQQLTAAADEYRHVRVTGKFLYELTTRVQAITELGSGFWLLTPLREADGSIVLVNRGFVAEKYVDSNRHAPDNFPRNKPPQANTGGRLSTISGLLRMSEPDGAFLRHNDAAANRWYSRDVKAIAVARNLSHVAPYFIDADAATESLDGDPQAMVMGKPVGGLTVISFHNNHLVYAITWYALALMVAAACVWIVRDERRLRRAYNAYAAGLVQGNEGVSKN